MMKTSIVKTGFMLGVLMAFLAGRAYADNISMTISVVNADGTAGPSITLTDSGGINDSAPDSNGDFINEYAGVGVSFSGQIGASGIYTTASMGLIENAGDAAMLGISVPGNTNILAMDVQNAGCGQSGYDCSNSQLVITLTDNGATVPAGQAIFTSTLGSDGSFGSGQATGSSVSVQSAVLTDGQLYTAFNPVTAATGTLTASGSGAINSVTTPYSIGSSADIAFNNAAGNASFELDASLNGCSDPTCNGEGALTGTPVNTPEPTSLLLLGSSLIGLGLLRTKYRLPL